MKRKTKRHWQEKDVDIDIKSVCPNAEWAGKSIVKVYLREYFRKVWLKFIPVIV